jgi:EmrB/QacA subfamily drug resistance transporter
VRVSGAGGPPVRAGALVLAVCLAQLVVVLDASIVTVALAEIRAGLGFTDGALPWVVNAYTITFAGLLLLGGRLADLHGRRRLLLGGLVLFAVASALGGLAQEPWHLVAARGLQGVGAALLAPATLTVLTTTFAEGPARTRALGAWTAVSAAGGAVGVLLGGLLTQVGGWRWVLLVNVPVVAVVVLLALRSVPPDRVPARGPADVLGAVLVTGGTVALVLALVRSVERGAAAPDTVLGLAAALALLAAFVVVERRTPHPLVPLGLFASRAVAGANAVALLLGAALFGTYYVLSLHTQLVLGWTPLQTGLAFLPLSLVLVAGSAVATRLLPATGPRALLLTGITAAAAGLLLFSATVAGGGTAAGVLVAAVVTGAGIGLCFVPVTAAATSGVRREQAGLASGVLGASRQLGGAVGLGLLAAVADAAARGGAGSAAELTAGYARALLVAAAVLVVGLAAALVVPGRSRTGPPSVRRS